MKIIIYVVLATLLGFVLSGIWFGANFILQIISSKKQIKWIGEFSVIISSVPLTAIVLSINHMYLLNLRSICDLISWGVIVVTVIVTSVIISMNEPASRTSGKDLFHYAIDGVFMEIPQRMMMQSFICLLLKAWCINIYVSAPINAVIWCLGLCIQCLITKREIDVSVGYELLSSFIFSLGVGVVLIRTEFIVFTMVAHFMECIVSTYIRKRKYD